MPQIVEIETSSWDDFLVKLQKLRDELGKRGPSLLFRGQGDSEWRLSTTLERAGCDAMSFLDYYDLVISVGPAVATFANVEVPEYSVEVEVSCPFPSRCATL